MRRSHEEPEFLQVLVDPSPPLLLHQRLPGLPHKHPHHHHLSPVRSAETFRSCFNPGPPLTFLWDSSPSPSEPSVLLRSGAMLGSNQSAGLRAPRDGRGLIYAHLHVNGGGGVSGTSQGWGGGVSLHPPLQRDHQASVRSGHMNRFPATVPPSQPGASSSPPGGGGWFCSGSFELGAAARVCHVTRSNRVADSCRVGSFNTS